MAFVLLSLVLNARIALAKDLTLTAIELYDGASGAAFIQLTNISLNGKAEMRDCQATGSAPIDKSAYSKLDKLSLNPGGVLRRGADGVLRYSSAGGAGTCVVPMNVKYERGGPLTPAAMADSMQLTASPIGPGSDGTTGTPSFKAGVTMVFVPAPDGEFAEYLLAERAASIAGWKNYLARYGTSATANAINHQSIAKDKLVALHVAAGEKALTDYQRLSSPAIPAYPSLREAKAEQDAAHKVLPFAKGSQELAQAIHAKLQALADRGQSELEAYNSALISNSPGYGHLAVAKALADGILDIDPTFAPGSKLQSDIVERRNPLEAALRSFAEASEQQQMDDALKFVLPYRGFAKEEPRIGLMIEKTYKFHMDRGKQAGDGQDWAKAVEEYTKATETRETAEARESLKDAQHKFVIAQDEKTAKAALERSQEFEAQKDFIGAYESLAGLTTAQQLHMNVTEEIERLAPLYIKSAIEHAKSYKKNFTPIKGLEDEQRVEQAYALLQSAIELTPDESVKQSCKTDSEAIADDLSRWFLLRAKHFLDKPSGSFTEVGWAYLQEAIPYKAANLDQVKDVTTQTVPAHEMHSKLSIRVHVLDQTSLRQSTGYAGQLEDAIIVKLKDFPNKVKAVRFGDPVNGEPDFELEGSVIEHENNHKVDVVSKDSTYRSGTHQEKNPDWTAADEALDEAKAKQDSDNRALVQAQIGKNKNKVQELNQKLDEDQSKISELRKKRDGFPENITKDEVVAYQYTQKTIAVTERIKLQFRISSVRNGQIVPPVPVEDDAPTEKFVLIEDVNSADMKGVKRNDTSPDLEGLRRAFESKVVEELKVKVVEKLEDLPTSIYQDAKAKEDGQNQEDAGEAYLRYLSVTHEVETKERKHAKEFLKTAFNFQTFPSLVQ